MHAALPRLALHSPPGARLAGSPISSMKKIALIFVPVIFFLVPGFTQESAQNPPQNPKTFMSVDEVKPGMKGIAWTVFQGTQPESMEVEVLGVLRNVNGPKRSEEHTSELQSPDHLVCRLLLEKKKKNSTATPPTTLSLAALITMSPSIRSSAPCACTRAPSATTIMVLILCSGHYIRPTHRRPK